MELKKKTILHIFIFSVIFLIAKNNNCIAQNNATSNENFVLVVHHKDSVIIPQPVIIPYFFETEYLLNDFITNLPKALAIQGYASASVDSIWKSNREININLYYGKKYNWIQFNTIGISNYILNKANIKTNKFTNKPFNINEVNSLKSKLLNVYQNNGYPFAKIFLDSIFINDNTITATLKSDTVLLYKVDSIKNVGSLKLKSKFLQRYLGIKNGSPYNIGSLQEVDRKMKDLPFAETMQLSYLEMLGTGSVLKLNVNTKKSSEASAIFGIQQNASDPTKYQLTGDINFNLKNVFGAGEGLLLKYQALQAKSPRLNIGYEKPYIFNSPYGVNFLADFYKRDSSFFQINAQVGFQYDLAKFQTVKFFVQRQSTSLLPEGVDTAKIRVQKILPNIIDVVANNLGFVYEFRNTNYKYNPIKGNEVNINFTLGTKLIKKNAAILSINQPGLNYESLYDAIQLKNYQIRVKGMAAHYFKINNTTTLKTAANFGFYNSPSIFRNDVFQIGGYKILRGFDEESIFVTNYIVSTAEYRLLLSQNSFLYGFVDAAITKTNFFNTNANSKFISAGLGMTYEIKAGLLNFGIALGKRNDVPFKLNQATKIHFGYINYF